MVNVKIYLVKALRAMVKVLFYYLLCNVKYRANSRYLSFLLCKMRELDQIFKLLVMLKFYDLEDKNISGSTIYTCSHTFIIVLKNKNQAPILIIEAIHISEHE